jgi:tRNA(Ile)-lysidine synthase
VSASPPGPPLPGALPPGQPRDALVAEVTAALHGVPARATVVIALSGGPDSTACAFLAAEARPDLDLVLAHVRHGLRDDRDDVAVVTTHASWLGATLEIAEVTVEVAGRGVEAEARSQRYAALRRIARSHDAGWLVLGHTADDQAETLLLRLARGTGVPGLAGMAPVRGDVVRPLLRLRRADVHRFVEMEGLPVAHDPTNDDPRFARNLVRHEVLPALNRLGPDVVGALARLADLARDDAAALADIAARTTAEVVTRLGPVAAVPREYLATADPALSRRVIRELVLEVRGGTDPPTASEVEAVRLLTDGALDLSGVTVTVAAGWTAVGPSDVPQLDPVPLEVPGATPWPVLHVRLDATTPGAGGEGQLQLTQAWRPTPVKIDPRVLAPGAQAELAQVALGGLVDATALVARTRAPGDRIATIVGTRKLQDVFVDAGVPRQLRDLLPIVCDGDRVVWVPGLAVDAAAHRAGDDHPQVHVALVRAGTRRPSRS